MIAIEHEAVSECWGYPAHCSEEALQLAKDALIAVKAGHAREPQWEAKNVRNGRKIIHPATTSSMLASNTFSRHGNALRPSCPTVFLSTGSSEMRSILAFLNHGRGNQRPIFR
jgi:hypothetical protein